MRIQQRKKMKSNKSSEMSQKKQREEIRMTNTMSLIIGSFLLCWTPFVAYFLLVVITGDRNIFQDSIYGKLFRVFAVCLSHMNPVVDPLLYAYRMKEVRDGIKKIFKCQKSETNQPKSITSASFL